MKRLYATVLSIAAVAALSACDNGGSAVETRERPQAVADVSPPVVTEAAPLTTQAPTPAHAPAEAAVVLTSNRRETAGAKAVRLYERNGMDFGAKSAEDYLDMAKQFTKTPPADAEKILSLIHISEPTRPY